MKFKNNTSWKWFGEKSLLHMRVHLFNVGETPSGKIRNRKFTTVEEIEHEPGEVLMSGEDAVTLSLEYEEAEQIIQELWNMGFRPHGIESSDAYVQSLKDHIKSLQQHIEHLQKTNTTLLAPAPMMISNEKIAQIDPKELIAKASAASISLKKDPDSDDSPF